MGIWMENKDSTLNLQQINSGKMFIYDVINGNSNKYNVNISGDNTGTLCLYNDITNGKVNIQNTKVNTTDRIIHEYTFSSLSSDENIKYTLDINFNTSNPNESSIDKFKILNTEGTNGTISIKALNFINMCKICTRIWKQ